MDPAADEAGATPEVNVGADADGAAPKLNKGGAATGSAAGSFASPTSDSLAAASAACVAAALFACKNAAPQPPDEGAPPATTSSPFFTNTRSPVLGGSATFLPDSSDSFVVVVAGVAANPKEKGMAGTPWSPVAAEDAFSDAGVTPNERGNVPGVGAVA